MRLVPKLAFLPAAALLLSSAGAQAPIERRPPETAAGLPSAPVPVVPTPSEISAEAAWRQFARTHHSGFQPELRIQAQGEAIRCDLEDVTPTEIYCVEHRALDTPIRAAFFPRQGFRVPRADVLDIREGGRDASTALGALIGIGVGVGVGSASAQSRSDGGQLIGGMLFGLLGGFIGHVAPFKGHVVYRQP